MLLQHNEKKKIIRNQTLQVKSKYDKGAWL